MKISKILPILITVILIGLSLFGVLEEQALNFVSDVYKKNGSFLKLITELKLIISGISSVKIPFVDGISSDVGVTIGKVQHFLLITDIVSFLQVLIISISKSWILKLLTVVLFLLSFPKKTKRLCSKLLLMSLALSPGLSIYSVAVQQVSQEASIDFGNKYLKKLKASVAAVKSEKAELMKQHTADITKINNGQKGIHILRKFREDVAYDFKKTKLDIKGSHANIRLLLKGGGHEITSKIFGFCSMILFTMILLPFGYTLLIYILFNTLFENGEMKLPGISLSKSKKQPEDPTKPPSFKTKLSSVFKTYLKEFHSVEKKVEGSEMFQKAKSEIVEVESKIVSTVKNKASGEIEHLKFHITDEVSKIKGEVIDHLKSHIADEISKVKKEVSGKIDIDKVKIGVESKVSGAVKTVKEKDSNVPPDVLSI